jgi:hypothetical protein
MTTQAILEKLLEVERALQSRDYLTARALVFQAQERVLELDRAMIAMHGRKVRVPHNASANWSERARALEHAADAAQDEPAEPFHLLPHLQAR